MSALLIVGDRVLIRPDDGDKQTKAGLYLPATVLEQDRVGSGRVEQVGPGYVMPNPEYTGEPWAAERNAVRYLPLQARPGDFAFFLRKERIEITFRDQPYFIVPHSAILALVRDEPEPEEDDGPDLSALFD